MKPQIVQDINQKATDAVTAIQNNPNLYEKYEQDYDKFLKTDITENGEKVEDISKLLGIFYFISKLKNNPNITNLDVPINGNKKISQIDDKLAGSNTSTEMTKVLYKCNGSAFINDINKINKDTSVAICNEIVESAIQDSNPESLIAALDVLMFAMYRMSDQDKISIGEKNNLIERLVRHYLTNVNQIAINAIEKQVFSFRKPDGSQFSNDQIVEFYTAEKPDNFTLKENLENIKEKVKESLDKFKTKIDEISQNYKTQIDGILLIQDAKFIRDWKTNVDDGTILINQLVEDEITLLNKEVETKVTEKSNYLSDLLKEADSYIKAGNPLPTFLLDPADGYTELGLVYDKKAGEDPLFDGQNPVTLLNNLRFDLSEQRYIDQLTTAGFRVTETNENIFVTDDKGKKTDTGRKYYQLSRNDNDRNKIKEFLGSASGKPRGVPNIYYKNGIGEKPQQIYSREFLAVYQKALVEEIKSVAEKSKANRVQINKCFFFTGEGKTHTIQRITNDIKFKKQADAALGKHSAEEMIVMDFNLQSDDLEEIKRKIKVEIDKNIRKKLSFVFQADEDPHTSADIKQFFYLDVYDFLTEDCNLEVGVSLGTINTISISGTPKQKRFDHLVDKIVTNYGNDNDPGKGNFNKYWFGDANNGKQSGWLDKESGKKEIRTLENLFNAYGNIGELFSSAETDDSKSIEGRISKNISNAGPIKRTAEIKREEAKEDAIKVGKLLSQSDLDKITDDARHIQYLMPDFSPNDSALLFAPDRLENLVKGILEKPGITSKDEFFVLLPPVADSVAKEIRSKAGDVNLLSKSQQDYINFLDKKKIVKFVKSGGSWKLESVSEGLEEALDPKSPEEKLKYGIPTERDCLSFYDQNTVVGGDYGKYSRDVTDVYIDDLFGREFGTDDLAQWIARNRTMDLRKKEVVDKVKAQCDFHFCGTQESLDKIKENAANDAKLTKAQFDIINAKQGSDFNNKIIAYNDVKKYIKPANDNDLTPLKKITERLIRFVGLDKNGIDKVIQTLDEYADGKSIFNKTSSTQDPISTNLLSDIIIFSGTILPEDKKLTANLYAKEYVEAQRARRNKPQPTKSVNLTLFDRAISLDGLSKKLETYFDAASHQKLNSIDECNLRDVFSLRKIWIGGQSFTRDKKISSLKGKLGFADEVELLPNYTILDLVNSIDAKYSRSDTKAVIRSKKLEKYLNVTLDKVGGTVKEFTDDVAAILQELEKNKENKKESSKPLDRRLESAKIASVEADGKVTVSSIKIDYPDDADGIKDKEISIIFKGDGKQNIYKTAKKEAKKIEKDLAKEYNLKKELEEVKKLYSDLNPNLFNKYDLLPLDQKLDGTELTSEALKPKLEVSIKALKADIIDFKTEGEKNILAEAERYLPNSHIERINQSDMADSLKESKAKYATANIDNIDNISDITIKDPNNLLFKKSDTTLNITEAHNSGVSNKEYLVKKLLLSLSKDIKLPDNDGNAYTLDITVGDKGNIIIKADNKPLGKDLKLKPFKSIEQTGHQILAYSEGNLGNILAAKREKKAVLGEEGKIQLYYSKPGSDKDNCFIDEDDSKTTIPHLSIQFNQDDKERRVVDAAISKTAYNDVFKYTAEVEEKVRDCINSGYGINGALIDGTTNFGVDVIDQVKDSELQKFLKLPTPIPINVDGNNFANVLERKEATNGNHLVKLDFLVDKIKDNGGKDKIEIPKDAPKFRYVQVNGTGTFGRRALKLKFTLDDKGELKYEGVFEKDETKDLIEFTKVEPVNNLTAEETKLIEKMKVVATRQVVDHTKPAKTVSLDQVIIVEKDHVAAKQVLIEPNITSNLAPTNIFNKANFDMKPNSLIKNPGAIKVMAGRFKGK